MDCSLSGSSIHGMFQARVLEWGANAFSENTLQTWANGKRLLGSANKVLINLRVLEYQTTWSASWEICMPVRKQQLELDMEQQTGSKLGKE